MIAGDYSWREKEEGENSRAAAAGGMRVDCSLETRVWEVVRVVRRRSLEEKLLDDTKSSGNAIIMKTQKFLVQWRSCHSLIVRVVLVNSSIPDLLTNMIPIAWI